MGRLATPALYALRTHRQTSLLIVGSVAAALAALLPVAALFHLDAAGLRPLLALVPVPGGDLGLPRRQPHGSRR
jgi:hypothetical protein